MIPIGRGLLLVHTTKDLQVPWVKVFAPKRVCIVSDVDRQKCLRAVELLTRKELTAISINL